jgi:hypothetical protein
MTPVKAWSCGAGVLPAGKCSAISVFRDLLVDPMIRTLAVLSAAALFASPAVASETFNWRCGRL